jgi:DNA polymerase-1
VWLAHNLSFDWHQLRATWDLDLSQPPYDRVTFHDTDVMARLLFPSGQYDAKGEYVGYKLKQLARVHLDPNADVEEKELDEAAQAIGYKSIKPPKTHRGPWLAYYDVWRAYPDVLLKYALQDARITYDLAAHFIPLLQANDRLWRLYELEMQVTPILVDAEQRGTHLDRARVESLYQDYKQREVEVYARLFDEHNWPKESLGGEGSQAALLEHLTETLGIPLYRTTDTGALKTDKYALQEFAGDFPALADFLEWRTIEKFLATYIEPMRDKDDVHPSFYQIGAWTGRMSCSRPNMQNIPAKAGSEVRDVFVAREGCAFAVSDYDSIEVKLLAYFLGTKGEPYRQLIRDGHDPHAYMAAQIATTAHAEEGVSMLDFVKGTPREDERSVAKNTMFAITYGAGAPRVADMNDIDKGSARELIGAIKDGLPGYHKLMQRLKQKVMVFGHVQTLGGRMSPIKKDKSYVALNAIIQGSAADIMKMGMVKAQAALDPFDWHIILVVHDEIVSEGPAEHAEAALAAQNHALETAFSLDPPLKATGKVVTRYGDAK